MYKNNETLKLTVSEFDVEELMSLVSCKSGSNFELSSVKEYRPKADKNIDKNAYILLEEIRMICNLGERSVSADKVEQYTKSIKMFSGLSLYNEMVTSLVSEQLGISIRECREIFLRQRIEPRGFLQVVSEVSKSVNFVSGELSLPVRERYLEKTDRRIRKIRQFVEGKIDLELERNFVLAMFKLEELSTSYNENIGDIEKAVIEALVFGNPIDLVFLKCPRMVQYRDGGGRNRLDVLTTTKTVTLNSISGERVYVGDTHLRDYFVNFTRVFKSLGIEVVPIILVMESDVENMFPINSVVGKSSLYESVVVPESDVVEAKSKAKTYTESLATIFVEADNSCVVTTVETVTEGTDYNEIKKTIFEDAYKSKFEIVKSKEFEVAVTDDLERYSKVYPNYIREHAKYKTANKVADMRALGVIVNKLGNPLIITRGPFPVKQAHLAVDGCTREKRRIIFADPERDDLPV